MKVTKFSIVLFAFCTLLMSCSDNDDNNNDYGRLSVKLTDAPFPHDLVAEANVTVFKVDARYKGNMEFDGQAIDSTSTNMTTENGKSFVVLMEEEVQVNLLELTNCVTQELVDLSVPVGTYDLIRVYVKGVNVILTDGTTFDLKVPSGSQSGIKVFIKPGLAVNGGLSSDLLLDFDISRSFVAKGNSKDLNSITGFNFKPVIKACNMSTAGTLMGLITESREEVPVGIEGAQVGVYIADTLNTSAFTDINGAYMIMGLEAGTYTVVTEKEGYIMQTSEDVKIQAANKTVLDFELLPEE